MSHHFEVLVHVAEGALDDSLFAESFTSRELGEALHIAQQFVAPWDRYRKPLRRGHTAGQVLRELRKRGLVERTGKTGGWKRR